MITATRMLYLYTETPLHAGVGSGLSSVDLPIQRERTTQYPMIQGSGIKGKLRSVAETLADLETDKEKKATALEKIAILYGSRTSGGSNGSKDSGGPDSSKTTGGSEHAGALIAGDARILLFPIRSLTGVFAYATSYDVLQRFLRDRKEEQALWALPPEKQAEQTAQVTQKTKSRVVASGTVVLEEFSFTAEENPLVDTIATWLADHALPQDISHYAYWRAKITDSLVILPEDDFRDFVVNATEIITRISIDRKTKTAAGTALWTEEHLPTDTLLYVPMYATNSRKAKESPKESSKEETPSAGKESKKEKMPVSADEILQEAMSSESNQGGYIQLGGDETVGRGLVRLHWEGNKVSEDRVQKENV